MPPKPILFADDRRGDAAEQEQIANSLAGDWLATFVQTGAAALSAMEQTAFPVVVSELILPDINAAQLHQQIAERYPDTLRLVLTAHTDRELMLATIDHVHHLLAKPCPGDKLKKILNNSIGLRQLLANEELRQKLADVKSLPSPPEIYRELAKELRSEDAPLQKIAGLIQKDVAITAKLLQMINSAFFGLPTHVESPLHAVKLLGLETVQSLVLTAGVFSQVQDPQLPGLSVESIHRQSIVVGTSAKHLAGAFGLNRRQVDDAFMAGMLHDVGKLVLLANFSEELRQALRLAEQESIPLHQAEKKVMGVGHAEIGAYLLSLWGLPDSILEAVALHQAPRQAPAPIVNVLTAVHVAYATDHDHSQKVRDPRLSALDNGYIEALGLSEQLPNLRRLCVTEEG
jgi:HD-like signal output (HDOD) protein